MNTDIYAYGMLSTILNTIVNYGYYLIYISLLLIQVIIAGAVPKAGVVQPVLWGVVISLPILVLTEHRWV